MDLSTLKDLGSLPFTTLSAGMLWQVLGPTAKYLGMKGQDLTQKAIDNLERILADAWNKLPADQRDIGEVPPRVLRGIVNEGAFTEDSVAAAYLGGVLASSKANSLRDDRGVAINSLISRLSVFQLRLHYASYMAMHYLFQGTELHIPSDFAFMNAVQFGTTGLLLSMGFSSEELHDPEFELQSALTHALYGLNKEELITDWEFSWSDGFHCSPTPIGIEVFLWANGKGRRNLDYFFDRAFEPVDCESEEILLIPGRAVTCKLDNGDEVTVNGFDYACSLGDSQVCKLPSLTNV